jgi:hypothetical protein
VIGFGFGASKGTDRPPAADVQTSARRKKSSKVLVLPPEPQPEHKKGKEAVPVIVLEPPSPPAPPPSAELPILVASFDASQLAVPNVPIEPLQPVLVLDVPAAEQVEPPALELEPVRKHEKKRALVVDEAPELPQLVVPVDVQPPGPVVEIVEPVSLPPMVQLIEAEVLEPEPIVVTVPELVFPVLDVSIAEPELEEEPLEVTPATQPPEPAKSSRLGLVLGGVAAAAGVAGLVVWWRRRKRRGRR